MEEPTRLAVGISGSSGVIYGIMLLQTLKKMSVETHVVISKWAKKNIEIETDFKVKEIESMSTFLYEDTNMAAPISSGSFRIKGMVIIPCSMKTLSSIANGYEDNLISRAASVSIKENRKLVLVPRETPLSRIHLSNMLKLSEIGVTILPAMPGFYHRPKTIDDLIFHIIGKTLDQFGLDNNVFRRWSGN